MPRSGRFNCRINIVKLPHGPAEKVGVFGHQFHGLKLFQLRFFGNFVLRFAAFFFKMACIGNVAHIPNLIPEVGKIAVQNIESYIRPRMPQVAFAAYGRAAHIHACMPGGNGFKNLSFSGIAIVQL